LRPSLPLVALVAAAAALALVAAYATVNSDRSYYAYGDITSANEAVNIKVYRGHFALPAGGQGAAILGEVGNITANVTNGVPIAHPFMIVKRQGDVENVKLLIRWVNARQVAHYFDYVKILFISAAKAGQYSFNDGTNDIYFENATLNGGQVKGFVTLRKPVTIITLDNNDFNFDDLLNQNVSSGSWENNTMAVLYAKVYYEGKEGMMETNLPLIFNVKLLQTS